MQANSATASPPSNVASATSRPTQAQPAAGIDAGSTKAMAQVLRSPAALAGALLTGILLAAYFAELQHLADRWANEADYSHGFIVPLFSLYLLWHRRALLGDEPLVGSWLGLPVLISAAGIKAAAVYLGFRLLEPLSFLPCLAGLALLLGGGKALRWSWPAIAFLVFAIPLPGAVSGLLSHPLQRIATIASVYALQTVGVPAVAQGNVIYLTEGSIGVVEACSGIRMLMMFFAITVGMAFVFERPLWEKALIAVSALGIAVFANVIRITTTGLVHETAGAEMADWLFHDLAGWLMMPLALVILGLELFILDRMWTAQSNDPALELSPDPHRAGGGKTAPQVKRQRRKPR